MTALLLRPKEVNLKHHQISENYSELDCKVGSQITVRINLFYNGIERFSLVHFIIIFHHNIKHYYK